MNVRIGELQTIDECLTMLNGSVNEKRTSRDKFVDTKGRRLVELFDDIGGIITNGRCKGDEEGEYTFVGTMGSSVNDLCVIPVEILSMDFEFSVLTETFSDHLPLRLRFREDVTENESVRMKLLPKIIWEKQNIDVYQSKILTNLLSLESSEINVEDIVKIIYTATNYSPQHSEENSKSQFKNRWFDLECKKKRDISFKFLKLFKRLGTDYTRKTYLDANNQYKMLCAKKKKEYDAMILQKLGNVRDAKEWGFALRELRGKSFNSGNPIGIEQYARHFQSSMNLVQSSGDISFASPNVSVPFLDDEFTAQELINCLKNCKNNKAPGLDRIPYECYKNAPALLIEKIAELFNKIYTTDHMPRTFKKSILFPIFKKGDQNDAGNYRGISFMDTIAKMYTGVLLARLESWIHQNNKLNEYQAGFRKGYSTIDSIYSLTSIIKIKCTRPKQKIYAFFVDFRAAFDTINRNALLFKLHNIGLSNKFVNTIQKLYTETETCIWNGKEISESFGVQNGVKQGCLLSPVLFSLFMNDLYDELTGGIIMDNFHVKLLMYADDIVILADSPEKLQSMITELELYCETWSLEVNPLKSKIMIFGPSGRRSRAEKWRYMERDIEIVNSYLYLGMELTPKLSFQNHLQKKLIQAKNNINSIWTTVYNNSIPLSSKLKIFEAVNRSLVCYGAQIWGFKEYEYVERAQRFFVKKVLSLPSQTPNYMMYIETGLFKTFMYTLKLHFSYIIKTLKYSDERLPNYLTKVILQNRLYFCEEWVILADKCRVDLVLQTATPQNLQIQLNEILDKMSDVINENLICMARNSTLHDEYKYLDYNVSEKYFNDTMTTHQILTIFKARGGMMNLNARAFQNTTTIICSMCNLNSPENVFHFIAICPILREFRVRFLHKPFLDRQEFLELLNGKEFMHLYNYIVHAMKYREFLVNEYNE